MRTVRTLPSSDGSGTEDVVHIDIPSTANRVKRKTKKSPGSPDSRLLQEYLHASSSSDVELDNHGEETSKKERDFSIAEPDKSVLSTINTYHTFAENLSV